MSEVSASTTRDRVRLVAEGLANRPGTGIRTEVDLWALLRLELGHEEVLDRAVLREGHWQRALAPSLIYHVCASNLAVSAETSLALGLVLGSRLAFKLPSSGLPGFTDLVASLPVVLRERVQLLPVHDPAVMARAGAVVVFGNEDTVAALHRETRWDQMFVAYGPKLSLGWVLPGTVPELWAPAAASEIRAFGQAGCLSPQAYLCPNGEEAGHFAEALAAALEAAGPPPTGSGGDAAGIRQARLRAAARGDRLWQSGNPSGWTVVLRQDPRIEPGPGGGYIEVVPSQDPALLEPWRGRISAVSVSGERVPEEWVASWGRLGIGRVCRMGDLQEPPLLWRHDGGMRLAPLVRWIACDPGTEVG
ncbi:MAG: acyl-CoA reductase [Candidatus Methylacidiphilales bacterium]|nr:acyl-CoA reductase [Candidatus Methylacidiphilales bacterium]